MSIRKSLTAGVTTVALVAATMAPLATAAHAGKWQGKSYGYSDSRGWKGGPKYAYRYGHRKHRSGDNVAKGLAIGLGALLIGTILASEAHRSHDYRYHD